jgi:hypothetical protein
VAVSPSGAARKNRLLLCDLRVSAVKYNGLNNRNAEERKSGNSEIIAFIDSSKN